jgi:hypothetical protein
MSRDSRKNDWSVMCIVAEQTAITDRTVLLPYRLGNEKKVNVKR